MYINRNDIKTDSRSASEAISVVAPSRASIPSANHRKSEGTKENADKGFLPDVSNACPLKKSGVLLTFDDGWNLSLWRQHLPLFEKYGTRCTFFINGAHNFNTNDDQAIKEIHDAGHEIAAHGANHIRAPEFIKEKGVSAYLRSEIEPLNAVLKTKGYEPTSFAYPMGDRNDTVDMALMSYYRHVRSGQKVPRRQTLASSDVFFTPLDRVISCFRLIGCDFDGMDEMMLVNQFFPGLKRLAEKQEVLVLFSHRITDHAEKNFVKPGPLEKLLNKVAELNLEFYRFCDLPSRFPIRVKDKTAFSV